MNERQKEILWAIAVLTCVGAGIIMATHPSELLLVLCSFILASSFLYFGIRITFEKDFYIKWYTDIARINAKTKNIPFDEQKEIERLREPFHKFHAIYLAGLLSLISGLGLLALTGGILWKYIF